MSDDPVLAGFRQSIDNIDAAMIHILAERFRITQAVGAYKAEKKLPASDPGARNARSRACAPWRQTPSSIPNSRKSSCASSSTK
jgi:chorismate mutase